VRGYGCHVWDDRGRRLIDLNANFTTLIHGHAHPEIISAAAEALRDGVCFGLSNLFEEPHARTLLARLPGADCVRYVSTGTEAVMAAIRLARAYTGRERLLFVKDAYHGWSDTALLSSHDHPAGVPDGVADGVERVPLNDVTALAEIVERNGHNMAAIILDLVPNRVGLIPLSQEFVNTARALANAWDMLLIFDEVMSFRLSFRGRQEQYLAEPDLTILGKLIGGGFPIGAVVGRASVMQLLNPARAAPVEHGGTFTANPVTLRAGQVALQLLTAEAISRLNQLGDELRRQLKDAADGWEVRGIGSFARLIPRAEDGKRDGKAQAAKIRKLWWAAYEREVLLMPTGLMCLSTPMDSDTVDDIVARLADASNYVSKAASAASSVL